MSTISAHTRSFGASVRQIAIPLGQPKNITRRWVCRCPTKAQLKAKALSESADRSVKKTLKEKVELVQRQTKWLAKNGRQWLSEKTRVKVDWVIYIIVILGLLLLTLFQAC